VSDATTFVSDPRALHYWDGQGLLGRQYRAQLSLSEDAWDVYLLYGPTSRWDADVPPAPAYWMHQLGSRRRPRVEGPWFDAKEFTRRAAHLLQAAS